MLHVIQFCNCVWLNRVAKFSRNKSCLEAWGMHSSLARIRGNCNGIGCRFCCKSAPGTFGDKCYRCSRSTDDRWGIIANKALQCCSDIGPLKFCFALIEILHIEILKQRVWVSFEKFSFRPTKIFRSSFCHFKALKIICRLFFLLSVDSQELLLEKAYLLVKTVF